MLLALWLPLDSQTPTNLHRAISDSARLALDVALKQVRCTSTVTPLNFRHTYCAAQHI
jgi:hypothetical protein